MIRDDVYMANMHFHRHSTLMGGASFRNGIDRKSVGYSVQEIDTDLPLTNATVEKVFRSFLFHQQEE